MRESRAIHVTDDDLSAGKPYQCARCPVTLAVRRAYPDATDVLTGKATVYMTRAGRRCEHALADHVQAAIAAIDAGEPVQPFFFALGPETFSYPAQERRKAA